MTTCSMGKVELIFLLENCLYVYVSNVFIIPVDHCSLNTCLFARYSFRIREDKRKWCVLKQVQSGTVKQGQNFPCPDQRCPIPSRSRSIQWWKNDLHNPGCLWMCRFVHLVISDIYSFFNFIFLLRMGVSTVLCWGILAMHPRMPGVFWAVNFNIDTLNPKLYIPSLACKCMKKIWNPFGKAPTELVFLTWWKVWGPSIAQWHRASQRNKREVTKICGRNR